jgi:hypothetical protein
VTNVPNKWQKVKRNRPCALCGETKGCAFIGDFHDPVWVLCKNVESTNCRGRAGWLHHLRLKEKPKKRFADCYAVPASERTGARVTDLGRLARMLQCCLLPGGLRNLGGLLGVSPDSLTQLRIGWSEFYNAWTFPMSAARGGP